MYGLLLLVISSKSRNLVRKFRTDLFTYPWEKIHCLYAFELMIHFLAEESFLDIYSDDILWNLTPGV